jgi:hypothetical protein
MRLGKEAGWNQAEADWRRFLELQPDGCFVAERDGAVLGTLTTCIFGAVAWIAMMLVDGRYRRQGIGSALMQHALEFLTRHAVQTIRLDATSLGQPLYEKFGFAFEHALDRYEGILKPAAPLSGVEPMRPEHLEEVLVIDQTVTRADRRKLLLRLASEFPETMKVVCESGRVVGFSSVRPGARAFQIGPCLASRQAGTQLLDSVRAAFGGRPVFMDIPTGNMEAVRWAIAAGLTRQRPLLRMCRGPSPGDWIEALWASSGPEMG